MNAAGPEHISDDVHVSVIGVQADAEVPICVTRSARALVPVPAVAEVGVDACDPVKQIGVVSRSDVPFPQVIHYPGVVLPSGGPHVLSAPRIVVDGEVVGENAPLARATQYGGGDMLEDIVDH
jgi:hypothetical protein